jgi:cyclic dehypoxanthinyl futalosine synthase
VDRVRQRISPLKAMSDDWLEVMDVAHRLGLYSSATMMFGHVETIEDRIEHLERLRAQQDKSKGIHRVHLLDVSGRAHEIEGADGRRARIFADAGAGRIYLDNFTNVQSSWVTQGLEIGQVALKYGANDFGSIMIEENVVSQAGTTFRMTVADMHRLIKDLGYEPHQRDNWYRA